MRSIVGPWSFLAVAALALTLVAWSAVAAADGPFLIPPVELEKVFDQAMAEGLEHHRCIGAAVAVVQDGKVLFSKGYGFQSLEPRVPVDPDRTLFRLGSITKTVTSTAISQLLERGMIKSIEDPANRYLVRAKLPRGFGSEVTIRHLLTHQAGFEDRTESPYRNGSSYPEWTPEHFARYTPAIVRPPGYASIYSNAGIGLLGLLVSDVTGRTYAKNVQESIFEPAGMRTAVIIDSPRAVPNLAVSYSFFPGGELAELPVDWADTPIVVPAGSLAASANDMARYMIGILGGSAEMGIPPLVREPSLAALRFERLAGNHPAVSGFGFGYFVRSWNGVDVAEHAGYAYGYRSWMTLIPKHNLGIFVSVTGEKGIEKPFAALRSAVTGKGRSVPDPKLDWKAPRTLSQLRAMYLEPLLGTRKPEELASGPAPPDVNLDEYAGEYLSARRNDATLLQAFDVVRGAGMLRIERDGADGLRIQGRPGYRPIARDVFWRDPSKDAEPASGWSDVYAFRRAPGGRIEYVTYGYGEVVYEPARGIHDPSSLAKVLTGMSLILLTAALALVWPAGALYRAWGVVMSLMVLALPAAFVACLADATEGAYSYLFTKGPDFLPFAILANLTWLLALGSVPAAVAAWSAKRPGWRLWFWRCHALVLVVGCALQLVFFANTGLIGFHLP